MSGSVAESCCTLPPVASDYSPQGTEIPFGDFTIYQTGTNDAKRVLICAYDIFGYHPNTKQVCDILAAGGFKVIMPDFFRQKPWDANNFPPAKREDLVNWVTEAGSWDKVVKIDLQNVLEHYKKEGAVSFGLFGFCWGGKIALLSVSEPDGIPSEISAGVAIHPAFFTTEDAEKVVNPFFLMPSNGEADMLPMFEILEKKLGAENCGHKRYETMHHGFCSARGDFKNEENREAVDDAISLMSKFFKKHLKD